MKRLLKGLVASLVLSASIIGLASEAKANDQFHPCGSILAIAAREDTGKYVFVGGKKTTIYCVNYTESEMDSTGVWSETVTRHEAIVIDGVEFIRLKDSLEFTSGGDSIFADNARPATVPTTLMPSSQPGYKYTIPGGSVTGISLPKINTSSYYGGGRSSGRCSSYYSTASDGSLCGRRAAPYR